MQHIHIGTVNCDLVIGGSGDVFAVKLFVSCTRTILYPSCLQGRVWLTRDTQHAVFHLLITDQSQRDLSYILKCRVMIVYY